MALQVVSTKVSVYKVTGVKDGAEQTEEYVFKQGDVLPDWVSSYQQFVLTQTGMAKQVGDVPDAALRAVREAPAPVLMPEHDPRTVLGTDVTGPAVVTKRVEGSSATGSRSDLPADDANKPEWEDYAVNTLGMKRSEAESMKKADLVREVKSRSASDSGDELPPSYSTPAPAQPSGASSATGGDARRGENAAKGGSADKPK